MPEDRHGAADEMAGAIDAALADNPALTEDQVEAVRALRAQAQDLCRAGRVGAGRECARRALAIIREGAPAPE